MSPQYYFAKQLIPNDILADPHRLVSALCSPAADGVLAAKWAHACATSGLAVHGPAPTVVGTTAGVDWQMVVVRLPHASEPNDAVFMAIMARGSDIRFFYYERCLGPDLRTPSSDEAVLAGMAGGSRIHCGTFRGLGLDDFVAALAHALQLPGLRLTAPAIPVVTPTAAHQASGRRLPSGRAAVTMLAAAAAVPTVLWGLSWAGVFMPMGGLARPVLSLVAVILTLVWLHRTFVALRGQTRFSPGMAVGGWFIPLANLLLPALVLRDAWQAARGRGGGVVWLWAAGWWLAIAASLVQGMGLSFFGEVGQAGGTAVLIGPQWHIELFSFNAMSLQTMATLASVTQLTLHGLAYGLLALVVHRISQGTHAR